MVDFDRNIGNIEKEVFFLWWRWRKLYNYTIKLEDFVDMRRILYYNRKEKRKGSLKGCSMDFAALFSCNAWLDLEK